jgi:hypothetical protein
LSVSFRNGCDLNGFSEDYRKIRSYLLRLNNPNYLFGRWDWMFTHLWLDKAGLSKIGIWENDDEIVAMATYDCELGRGYFVVRDGYSYLKKEMLNYSMDNFSKDGEYKALISDSDTAFHDIASAMDFVPTQEKESDTYFSIDARATEYALPEGFRVSSMSESYDIYKYGEVLWKGFDHEQNGEGRYNPSDKKLIAISREMKRPNVNLDIKIVVSAPNGDFASYCGMWQDPDTEFALVEPVATVPEYRKLGDRFGAIRELREYARSSDVHILCSHDPRAASMLVEK